MATFCQFLKDLYPMKYPAGDMGYERKGFMRKLMMIQFKNSVVSYAMAICIVYLFISSPGVGQEIKFRNIGMNEGLSFNSALCVIQDHEGLIWIGTRDGINKYDGVDNIIYRHNFYDSLSLSNNHVNSVFEDSQKRIWVGTANGLNAFDRKSNRFTRYYADATSKSITHRYVKCITEDNKGDIWVGTADGINIFSHDRTHIIKTRIKEPASHANNIIALYSDSLKNMWICTRSGLYVTNDAQDFKRVFLSEKLENHLDIFEFRDITIDAKGIYWVATENHGLFSFRYENGEAMQVTQFHTSNSSIKSDHIRKLKITRQSELWCATLEGISIVDIGTGGIQTVAGEGLSNSSFHDIMEDKDGGIWLATYTDGINYYHRQNNLFTHVKKNTLQAKGLNDNSVTGFLEDGLKGIWVSTGGGGINYFDKEKGTFQYYTSENSGLSNNNIKSMAKDRNDNLWIGTYHGLNFYNLKEKTFTPFYNVPADSNSLIQNQIHAILVDRSGQVWIGTNGGGVQVYHPTAKSFTNLILDFPNINTIYEDTKDRIWIGTNGGLECIDRGTLKPHSTPFGKGSHDHSLIFINSIIEDHLGRMFIGTQNHGLCIIDGEKLTWVNGKSGFSSNTINAVIESDDHTYWVSTNKGIVHLTIHDNSMDSLSFSFTEFETCHGLQHKQFYPSSTMKDSKGYIFFGGVNGYNTFLPSQIEKRHYHPPVVISELVITHDDANVPPMSLLTHLLSKDTTITLAYNQRNILLKFAGLSYMDSKNLQYRYKLNDRIDRWNSLQNQRSLNITYLPIGEHELKLQASTNPSLWGTGYTTLKLEVLPPPWRTWWAYLFYVLVLALMLYFYFHFSYQWAVLKSKLNMEQFQKEKEKELHETKLRFFTDISHELRTPLTLILAPIENILLQPHIGGKFRSQLQLIQRNGTRMAQLINQLLDLRKLETGNDKMKVASGDIIRFIREICLAFNAISEINNIELQVSSTQPQIPVWFDRDKMEIVFYNILSNAFKYTPKCGKIQLDVKLMDANDLPAEMMKKGHQGGLEIVITDSGQGILPEDMKHIFERFYAKKERTNTNPTGIGLELAKRMIEMHHGHIYVKSSVETYESHGFTSFVIYLLLGKDHFAKEEIQLDFKNSEDISQYTHDFIQREKLIETYHLDTEREHTIFNKKKRTILIVEDNAEVRSFITELLRPDYNVHEAENGKIGVEEAIRIGPDLIISDIMMPEMNGIEMCRQIKVDQRVSHIPVILLTARTAITFKYEGYETGADEYITKPFSASYLQLRVKNLLQQRDVLQKHFHTKAILEPSELSITSVDEKLLKKAINYINNNISNTNITVNELSAELGLSRVHFYRKMKALTNLTAIEFIRSIRLRQACQLLEQGKFNIKEVKNLVGFENADYFRNCFKEAYNMTPSEYAELHKKEIERVDQNSN